MTLSKRLLAIYNMVEAGSVVADIGCDHGFLPIALVEDGVCTKAYACDLRKGPLQRASEAIHQHGLEANITTLLRDGMNDLPNDVTTIVIAGMGFDTIITILEAQLSTLTNYHKFIIQSNSGVDTLRSWISEQNFTIVAEDIVEDGHFYQLLAFQCVASKALTPDQIEFGIQLDQHPLFSSFWSFKLTKLKKVLKQMPKENSSYEEYKQRIVRIENKLIEIDK